VVIDDFDLVGVALAKFEADTPACIDGHGPLVGLPPMMSGFISMRSWGTTFRGDSLINNNRPLFCCQ
jgi:hypothetical protein